MLIRYTFRRFVEILNDMGLKQNVDWTWNVTDHILKFIFNGSMFLFGYASTEPDAEKLRGGNLAAFWIDEAAGVPETAFRNLMLSLRQGADESGPVPKYEYPLMGWVTTTPPEIGKNHWLYKVFFQKHPDDFKCQTYTAASKENPYGGTGIHRTLTALLQGDDSPYARRELYGEFISSEGLVFPGYDPYIHDKLVILETPKLYVAGVDWGFSAPLAIVVMGYTPIDYNRGYRYLVKEFYHTRMSTEAIISACQILTEKYGIRLFVCDSSEPRLIGELCQRGIQARPVRKGRGSILYHKLLCSSALSMKDDNGNSTFNVLASAVPNWKFEIENYSETPNVEGRNPSEQPRQLNDHAMQAWGYAESAIADTFRRDASALKELSLRL